MNSYGNGQDERENTDNETEEKDDTKNTVEVKLGEDMLNTKDVEDQTEVETRKNPFFVKRNRWPKKSPHCTLKNFVEIRIMF